MAIKKRKKERKKEGRRSSQNGWGREKWEDIALM